MLPPIKWTPSPNYSSRGAEKVRLIVAHDCEGSYAGSVAWFAMAQSRVSAHLVLSEDGSEATQMVAWNNKAWHVCDFNPFSEGIEAAGYAAKGFPAREWSVLAALVAWRLHERDLPCQEATPENNWTGFTQHAKLGAAGGGHHDLTESQTVWRSFVDSVSLAYGSGETIAAPIARSPAPSLPTSFTPSSTQRCDEPVGSIAWAQSRLNALGARPLLTADGIEGAQTESAIRRFQISRKLRADGLLGEQTIHALR